MTPLARIRLWWQAREATRLLELERISHSEAIRRLGYEPDAALLRTRRALPPKIPEVRGVER